MAAVPHRFVHAIDPSEKLLSENRLSRLRLLKLMLYAVSYPRPGAEDTIGSAGGDTVRTLRLSFGSVSR